MKLRQNLNLFTSISFADMYTSNSLIHYSKNLTFTIILSWIFASINIYDSKPLNIRMQLKKNPMETFQNEKNN